MMFGRCDDDEFSGLGLSLGLEDSRLSGDGRCEGNRLDDCNLTRTPGSASCGSSDRPGRSHGDFCLDSACDVREI